MDLARSLGTFTLKCGENKRTTNLVKAPIGPGMLIKIEADAVITI